ncbi:uncharacterized protein LOC134671173 [Cydia fagiglandana]|uniref:uncharacterized protein LOC134671173 n=1 Tax=Cydia fagiglandana TaxID=1458189 RepID=UPI002FEDF642
MEQHTIKLTSFNCKSVKRSVDYVRQLCQFSDIIALQESWLLPTEIPYLGNISSEFSFTGTSAVDTSSGMLKGRPYGGVALLWRSNLFQCVTVLQCSNPRICAVKIVTNDRPFIVVCVYMPTDCSDNLPEFTDCLSAVSAIVDECEVESVYILGDFNAHPGELFFTELSNYCDEQNWVCVDINRLGLSSDTYTFISEAHGSRRWLDHCIVTQSAISSVRNVHVKCDVVWSDHFPLILECNIGVLTPRLTAAPLNNTNCAIWGDRTKEQIAVYTQECDNRLRNIHFPSDFIDCGDKCCSDSSHEVILDNLYRDIVSALSQSAIVSKGNVGIKKKNKNRIVGWNRHVKDAHWRARQAFLVWVCSGKPIVGTEYNNMCESRRIFKSRLKWCQDHQNQIQMDIIASQHSKKDFKAFWKSTSKLNVRSGPPASVEGVTDHRAIANIFRDHFTVKPSIAPSCERVAGTGAIMNRQVTRISALEVAKSIKSMSGGKSPGHDGLSVEHLRYAGCHISRVLSVFYSLCIAHSYLPIDLIKTVVIPVVKNKTGDLTSKTNYRPISLATVMAKVLDGVLNAQLNKNLSLHDNQFGFRPGLSTESAILCLKHTAAYYVDRNTPVYACYLDLSKAFDLVSYDILWKKLEGINLAPDLIGIFRYWYGNQINNVRWAGTLSETYRLECGVRQGGLSSPSLFNLYMNELIVALSSMHVGCHIDGVNVNNLSYADDMVLLSASVCGIRKLLKVCEDYAHTHGLKYNTVKSQYMVFGVESKIPSVIPPIRINTVALERVYQYKYLGHIVTADLKDDADIERERRALSIRANMIARRFARCSKVSKVTLFRAFCTTFYTCSLWRKFTLKSYKALQVQYNNAFRALMGLPRYCSASGMFAEAHVSCFKATMRLRAASLVRRVRASSNSVLEMIADKFCPYIAFCCGLHTPSSTVVSTLRNR